MPTKRNPKGAKTLFAGGAGPSTQVAREHEREALLARVFGEEWVHAIAAVKNDPVLAKALADYREQGGPPIPLAHLPLYKRQAALDEAFQSYARAARGGPCAYCGTKTARHGRGPFSSLDTRTEPSFTTFNNRPACEWCASVLRESGEERLAQMVYAIAVGLHGVPLDCRKVPFAHQMPATRDGLGQPWGYLRPERLLKDATRFFARKEFSVIGSVIPGLSRPTSLPPQDMFPEKPTSLRVGGGADLLASMHEQADKRAERERRALESQRVNMLRRKAEIDADPDATREERAWAAFDPKTFAPIGTQPRGNTVAEHIANRIRRGQDPEAEAQVDRMLSRKKAGAR